MLLKPFVINSHGRIVFPGNFFPELDFSVFKSLKQLAAVIRRDFGEKALTDVEIAARVQAGEYKSRYELCRDLALNFFWVNRYTFTMYEKRPTRWRDLPRQREDVFLPVYKPRDASAIARRSRLVTGHCPHRGTKRWRTGVSAFC
jgi:3-oxoacyl-[acyl-carrier-protein] synthase-3